jgi:glutathione peroxidase
MNIYDFTVKTNGGAEIALDQYKGKVLLIVNTATKCGLTPQYAALEALYQQYRKEGLEVLDFPCNQFLKQAPGTDEEIQHFCTLKYHTTFPRFSKVDVNGPGAHPLFGWLKEQAPHDKGDKDSVKFEKGVRLFSKFKGAGDIKWNFGKFLIDRTGAVAGRYSPAYTPDKLGADVEALLKF